MLRSLRPYLTAASTLLVLAFVAAPASAQKGTFSLGGNFGTGIYSSTFTIVGLELTGVTNKETTFSLTLESASAVTFDEAPAVLSLSVITGPAAGGTSTVITGLGFTGATAVRLATVNVTSFVVNSNTQITATVAAGTVGAKNVTVTNNGIVSLVNPDTGVFTYT